MDEPISDTFTTLKKSPQNTEISEIIRADCGYISEVIGDYSHSIRHFAESLYKSRRMLREFDKSGDTELENKLLEFLSDMDSKRLELERNANK